MQKPLDVLVIGAGFAGICVGIKLLEKGITNFRIVEKSGGIGGTWYENTYPGAACDVPSHLYCYSFEPNPNWSRMYAPQREIHAYIEHCAKKYGVRPFIQNGRQVICNRLDEATGLWETHFANGEIVHSRHVVSGIGGLHVPKIPAFLGQEQFASTTMHSAQWNHDYDLRGKRVAIIGTAASAIQIVPELARTVEQLHVFQRTPNYIAPRNNFTFSTRTRAIFRRLPLLSRLLRAFIFLRMELMLFPIVQQKQRIAEGGARRIREWMAGVVEDETLHDALTPDYALGCKRMLVSDHFYQSLNQPNTHLHTTPITRFVANGIQTADGTVHEVDCIVYATGFDIEKHLEAIAVFGRNATPLSTAWADIPTAYRGVCTAGFPNYWFVTGPNTGVGTTSIIFMIEQAVGFIMQCIDLSGSDKLVGVKQEAMDRYNAEIQAALNKTVWASGCKSWYLREDGRIATLYPHNARTWQKIMRRIQIDDMIITKP